MISENAGTRRFKLKSGAILIIEQHFENDEFWIWYGRPGSREGEYYNYEYGADGIVTVRKYDSAIDTKPLFRLNREIWGELVEAINDMTDPKPEVVQETGALTATKYHLEDLRILLGIKHK